MRALSPRRGDAGPAWATRYEGGCARRAGALREPDVPRTARAGRMCAPGGQSQRSKLIALSAATIVCMASSSGSVSGWSSRKWAPRLSSRRLLERGARGARAEHEALAERVGGEAVGAVQAGAGALADRVEAGQGRARRAGRSRSRPSCSGRPARPGRARARDRSRPASARRRSGTAPDRPRACRARPSCAAASISVLDRPATSSRGASSSTKRSPSGVEQQCALAADRLGHEEPVAPLRRRRPPSGETA
jgi:hypothetical protein